MAKGIDGQTEDTVLPASRWKSKILPRGALDVDHDTSASEIRVVEGVMDTLKPYYTAAAD